MDILYENICEEIDKNFKNNNEKYTYNDYCRAVSEIKKKLS
jgi:hypothetical protein